jgi:transcriptional regulator with XRE-family HTH domain
MKSKNEQMWDSLKDPELRRQFIDAHVDEGIAFQIRSLRNKRPQTQPEFAKELGVKQPLVSAWENPNYGKYSLNTLKKLAKVFDVGLLVRFVPFSQLVDWTISPTYSGIAPPSFREEQYQLASSASLATVPTPTPAPRDINANDDMIHFVNSLVPGTFSSTATPAPKELAYA